MNVEEDGKPPSTVSGKQGVLHSAIVGIADSRYNTSVKRLRMVEECYGRRGFFGHFCVSGFGVIGGNALLARQMADRISDTQVG